MMQKLRFKTRWKQKEKIFLLERLSIYVSAGLPLDKTLETIAMGFTPKQKSRRQSIENALSGIRAGASLSASLRNNVGLPDSLVSLISHGESSGELAKTLRSAHLLMEKSDELKKKVISAMIYPVVIGLFAAGLTIALVRGVMPEIIPMLKSLHVQLPLMTRVVIGVSEFLTSYGLYCAVGLVMAIAIIRISYGRAELVRRAVHSSVSAIPLIGPLVRDYSMAVFLHSFGSLVESGVPVGRAYADTAETVSFIPVRALMKSKVAAVSRGSSIGLALRTDKIPAHIGPLISVGEASGTLGVSVIRAGDILDRNIEHSLKHLTSLIEPVMMAGMGVAVGSIAVSIMMPIYDISRVLQH